MPNFSGNEDFLQIRQKKYLNASLCKFFFYSLQHSETFDVSHVFLPLTNAELSTLKQVRFFWPTLYILENFFVILHPFAEKPPMDGFAQNFAQGSSRGRNQLFQILCRSVERFWICAGSNFAILH